MADQPGAGGDAEGLGEQDGIQGHAEESGHDDLAWQADHLGDGVAPEPMDQDGGQGTAAGHPGQIDHGRVHEVGALAKTHAAPAPAEDRDQPQQNGAAIGFECHVPHSAISCAAVKSPFHREAAAGLAIAAWGG